MLRFIVAFMFVVSSVAAYAQEDHTGEHPAQDAVDPYLKAKDTKGNNCCHGQDCKVFYGSPVRTKKGELNGWQFGKWFVADSKLIDPTTLPDELKFENHICVYEAGAYVNVRCGWVAANG